MSMALIQRCTNAAKSAADWLREQLLPGLEAADELNPPAVFQRYHDVLGELPPLGVDAAVIKQSLDFARSVYDDEERRRESVLERVNPTLTTAGFALALFGGLAALLGEQLAVLRHHPWVTLAIFFFLIASLIYLLYAVTDVLRVYRPGPSAPTHMIGPEDLFPLPSSENEYILKVARKLIHYAVENYKPRNLAMTRIDQSQRLVRNGLWSIGLAALVLLVTVVAA